jgi:surface glycoprotein (TIGR04207 family)
MSGSGKQLRAIFLAFVMITSVVGGVVAFSESVAATASVQTTDTPADIPGGNSDTSQELAPSNIEINGIDDGKNLAITIDVSDLAQTGADLSGADVDISDSDLSFSGNDPGDSASVALSNFDANANEIQLVIGTSEATGMGTSTGDGNLDISSLDLTGIDTSNVNTASGLTYVIRAEEDNNGDFGSGFSTEDLGQTGSFNIATVTVENIDAGQTITTTSLSDAIDEANDPTSGDLDAGSAGDQVEIRLDSGTFTFDTNDVGANGIADDNTRINPVAGADVTIENAGGDTTFDIQATGIELVNLTLDQNGQAHEAINVGNDHGVTITESNFTNSDGTEYIEAADDAVLDVSTTGFDDPNTNDPSALIVTDGAGTDEGEITLTDNSFDGLGTALDFTADLDSSGNGLSSFSATGNQFGTNVIHFDNDPENPSISVDTVFAENDFEEFVITTDDSDDTIVTTDGPAIYGDLTTVPGNTVNNADTTTTLSAGDHTISGSSITLNSDNIDIVAASGTDPQNVTVDVSQNPGFSIDGPLEGLTIDGITFEAEANSIVKTDGLAADTLKDITITNNRFVSITGVADGILDFDANTGMPDNQADVVSATIDSNTFESNADTGNNYQAVVFGKLIDDGNPTEVTISSNVINGTNNGGIAAEIDDSADEELLLDIVDNEIEVTGANAGIDLEGLDNSNDIEETTVSSNTLTAADSGTSGSGIEVSADATAIVSITTNSITGFSDDGGEGIDIDDASFDESGLTVEENTLDDNGEHIHYDTGSQDVDTLRSNNNFAQLVEVFDDEGGSLQTEIFYGTIAGAVDDVASGDFVAVGPGTYDENSVSPGVDQVTIAATDGPDSTTVVPVSGNTIFNLDQDRTVLSGFTIDSSGVSNAAGDVIADNTDSDTITVTDNVLVGSDNRVGIEVDGGNTVNIRSNEISGFGTGVEVATDQDTPFNIVENQITNNTLGVDINDGAADSEVNFNNIVNNDVGLENDEGDDVIDAKANWWGAVTGPSGSSFSGSGDEIAGGTAGQLADNQEVQPWLTFSVTNLPKNEYVVITDPEAPVADNTDNPEVVVAVLNETVAGNTDDTTTRLISDPSSSISGTGSADAGTAATTADPLVYNGITASEANDYTLTARDKNGNVRQGSAVQTFTGEPADINLTADSDTLVADGSKTVNFTMTVVDSSGNPVAVGNEEVEYLIDNSSNAEVTREVEETATDDSSPTSEARLAISADRADFEITVTALFDSGGSTNNAGGSTATATVATTVNQLDVVVSPQQVTANNQTDVTINVTNVQTDARVEDATVNLNGPGVSENVLTDANGSTTVTVNASEAGSIDVNVSTDGFEDATSTITVEEDAPAYYTLKLSNSIADRDVHAAIISTFSTHRQSGSTALLPHSVYRYTRTHTGGQR